MDGLGKERSICSSRPFPWLSHAETETSSRLWNLTLTDCFSSYEKNTPYSDKQNEYMDSRKKPVLELKDVPPPPHPTTSSSSQPFPLAPLPLPPPPGLQPPPPPIPQQQDSLQQQGGSPKVSVCTHCEGSLQPRHCSASSGYRLLSGGGRSGAGASGVSLYMPPSSLSQAPSNTSRARACSMACGGGGDGGGGAMDPLGDSLNALHSPGGYKLQAPPSVATSQPLSSSLSPVHTHLPCCTQGLLHSAYAPIPYSQASLPPPPSDALLAAPLRGSACRGSAGYYPFSVDYSPAPGGSRRATATHGDHYHPTTTASQSHLCSNPMHLNIECTVCLKGAHYCRECLSKPTRGAASEPDHQTTCWPGVPPPPLPLAQSAPMCNGCGGTSSDPVLLPGSGLAKAGQKYGAPEGGPESVPPVGVFWDIENCCVPSGRSAAAVVQRLRARFFQGHREAEFMCVCDISKENKAVIQELNNCQVTVAHINATAKNAADDKLRQSLRRFAETHAAPATVVLVSSDVNFASELSDLRHRHGFQVILVHNSEASPALLQHAHHHVTFQEITANLPPRMAVKSQEPGGGLETKPKMGFHLEKGRASSSSPRSGGGDSAQQQQLLPQQPPKPGLIGESMYCRRASTPRSATDSPVGEQQQRMVDCSSGEFQVSTPSAFSKLSLHRSFSPMVLFQGSWSPSPRSTSPCQSSRSSPLLAAPRSPLPYAGSPQPFSDGADVQVVNLDYRMSRKELQQILQDIFSRHGRVKGVELSPHTDYQLKATVQMGSLQQAISAVSGLHRYKIGGKRIHVSLITGGSNKSQAMLSSEVVAALQDAPAGCLPLFKFTGIYEKKYGRKLVASDLYRLPEVVSVREQGGARMVCLLPSGQARQSPLGSSQSQEGSSSTSASPVIFEELEYHDPVCRHHYPEHGFSEADFDPDSYKIPFVVVSLKTLSPQVHSLVQSHDGTLPLLSFPECYASEFSLLQLAEEGQVEGGVPLEHLITCVPGITIVTAQNGFKIIKWIHNKPPVPNTDPWVQRCRSPVGNPQLIQFSREVVDLMKSRPACTMLVGKFIPAYHHHFAKQCRVSDYGYSKLLELLEAVPHVLQILGMGTKRLLTLTHRAQVKRFTQDLLKLLKFQVSKQVAIRDFMQAYHWCFSRDWRVIDYGMCDLLDLLAEIPDTTVTVTHQDDDTVISVPKRERTAEEVERTRQFGKEVVDLLRHQPHCTMPFSKFIPTYHHHFGRQCKLTYYGFTKLMELFEAIPDVLVVLECGEDKVLTLTEVERVKALAAQLVKLLRAQRGGGSGGDSAAAAASSSSGLPANKLLSEYSKTFGYALRLQDYDASSLPALLAKLCHVVKVVDGPSGREVQLINRKSLRQLTCQLLALLMAPGEEEERDSVSVGELSAMYQQAHGVALSPCEYGFLSLSELLKSLPYLVELFYEEETAEEEGGGRGEEWVRLTRLYRFARAVRALLHTYHYHQIFLTEFPAAYGKFTGGSLQPRAYGYSSTDELLCAIPQVVWIKGHGHKRIIVLKNDMKVRSSSAASNSPQPEEEEEEAEEEDGERRRDSPCINLESGTHSPAPTEAELLCLSSPVDLLCGPVPSCLPSPQLRPDPVLRQADLIHFEEQMPTPAEGHGCEEEADGAAEGPPAGGDEGPKPGGPSQDALRPTGVAQARQPRVETNPTNTPAKRAPRNKVKLAANFSFTGAR